MTRKGSGQRRKSRTKSKTICTGGSCYVCRPAPKYSKTAYKRCIVNALKAQKFVSPKSARRAFALAAKKCSVISRKKKTRRGASKRSKTTRVSSPRSSVSGGIPRSWQKRRTMSEIRPDLW